MPGAFWSWSGSPLEIPDKTMPVTFKAVENISVCPARLYFPPHSLRPSTMENGIKHRTPVSVEPRAALIPGRNGNSRKQKRHIAINCGLFLSLPLFLTFFINWGLQTSGRFPRDTVRLVSGWNWLPLYGGFAIALVWRREHPFGYALMGVTLYAMIVVALVSLIFAGCLMLASYQANH